MTSIFLEFEGSPNEGQTFKIQFKRMPAPADDTLPKTYVQTFWLLLHH